MRCLAIILLAIVGLPSASLGQEMPADEARAEAFIRYSGYDGVEFEYPETWARLQVHLLWQRPPASPAAAAMRPIFGIGRNDGKGDRVAAFTYISYALEVLPEDLRETRAFAASMVAELRQEDPQSIRQDVTPMTLAGLDGFEYSMTRPRPAGGQVLVHCWLITWRDRHFMFSVGLIGEDAKAKEHAFRESKTILSTLKLRTVPRQPDGTFTRISDGAGLSFRYPSHWHDLPAIDPWMFVWTHIDEQGQERAVVRVITLRQQGGDEPREVLERLSLLIDPSMGQQQVLSEAERTGEGFAGLQRVVRVTKPDGQIKDVYLLVLKNGTTYFTMIGIVPEADGPRFANELDTIVSSLSVEPVPFQPDAKPE